MDRPRHEQTNLRRVLLNDGILFFVVSWVFSLYYILHDLYIFLGTNISTPDVMPGSYFTPVHEPHIFHLGLYLEVHDKYMVRSLIHLVMSDF